MPPARVAKRPSILVEALIGGVGALVILLFVFGTLPAVAMPLLIAVASILNTFTLVWLLTYLTDVSIIVQFLIALVGLGVAIDYALLMIFRFREELRHGRDTETALVETMTHAGRSVIVSGSTVAVGLLSMIFLPLPFIRSIGIGGMLIPAVSVLVSITLLPALLSLLGPRINSAARDAEALRRVRCRRPAAGAAGRGSSSRRPWPVAGRRRGDRRRVAVLRPPAEPERGAGQGLPWRRRRDRRPRRLDRAGITPGVFKPFEFVAPEAATPPKLGSWPTVTMSRGLPAPRRRSWRTDGLALVEAFPAVDGASKETGARSTGSTTTSARPGASSWRRRTCRRRGPGLRPCGLRQLPVRARCSWSC